ncbi:MAG: ParB/RepB/Spo0J family partition protein [Treponema sp.]|nr:ParB/RepB/Spo0J family partition protein [Treponema sp.]
MAPKRGLGKGLDALFNAAEIPGGIEDSGPAGAEGGADKAPVREIIYTGEASIPLDKLRANPDQPRKNFDETELRELADSIREHGVIQPVLAEDAGDGTYTIIAGERRCRAARMAGLGEVPVLIRDYSAEKRMIVSLIENVQRSDLNPIEEAAAYQKLITLTGLSQDEVAARVGKSRSAVANALRLLKLPEDIRGSLEMGEISPGHARAILAVTDQTKQAFLFEEILASGVSVREAERRAAELNGAAEAAAGRNAAEAGILPPAAGGPGTETPGAKGGAEAPGAKGGAEAPGEGETGRGAGGGTGKRAGRAPELDAMEEKFITTLGTKVVIEGDLNRGRIHIDYYSMEDLERLYEILGKQE